MREDLNFTVDFEGQPLKVSTSIRKATDKWLVCLHGLQTSKKLFASVAADSRFDTYSLLCPDLVGFGDSEKSKDFSHTLKDQLQVVYALLEEVGVQSFYLLGHSLGGMIGTMMLKESPDRIIALCSIEGNLALEDCGESKKVAESSFSDFETELYSSLLTSLKESTEPSAPLRIDSISRVPANAFFYTSKSIVERATSNELLKIFLESELPRLLLIGSKSSFRSRPSAFNLESIKIENAAHFVPIDNESAYLSAVSTFFNRF